MEMEPIGMEPIGMEPIGMEPIGMEPTRAEPAGCMQCWLLERWRNMSLTMKILFIAIIFILIVVIAFWSSTNSKENVNNLDLETDNPAVSFMKSLDQSAQPCEDFYAFACGNLRNEYSRENKDRVNTIEMMKKRVRVSLDDFLTKPPNTSDSVTLREMKIFQRMCANETKVETEGIEPVLTLLNEVGGWPLLKRGLENTESWEGIVGSVNRAGFATFFPYHLELYPDPNNSSATAMLLKPLLHPKRPPVLPIEQRTVEYVKRVATLLNATNGPNNDDIKDCINFESELFKLTISVVKNEETHTLDSLMIAYPEIAWKSFFRNAFVSTGMQVSSNETVVLSHPNYNSKVSKLLNRTPTNVIRNYVIWRLIEKAIPLMPERFREAKNAFEQRAVGQSRNLDCVDALIDKASVSIGYLYIKHYTDGFAKNKSHGMIKIIESQVYRSFKNISWMDNNTNTKLIEALRNSEIMVPHPDDSVDVMETLAFRSNDTIFANYRRLAEAHRNLQYSKLRMSRKAYRQFIPFKYATQVGAYYFPTYNATYLTAAFLQRPFFSTSQPMYLNYGGIGLVMAYQMTPGRKILSVCNYGACLFRFYERKECIKKLYSGYVLKQLNEKMDGTRTVSGNINDLIALKLSYHAYEEFARGGEEQLLPGLKYTARQWFWINAATTFCSYESDAELRHIIKNNVYSPAEARVNVAFANTEEFSQAFGCPIGSPMNPVRKCRFL